MRHSSFALAISVSANTIALLASIPAASAQSAVRHLYHLPPQALAASLDAVAGISGRGVLAPAELLAGKQATALDGDFTPQEAVDLLLRGSGLRAHPVSGNLVIGRDIDTGSAIPSDGADIVVTGSRVRGAAIASPVIRLGAEEIRDAGQNGLGEVARSIPQSFGGGQNPGIALSVPSTNATNVGGGSTINLRGLGSDATLTLLNGHRLTYTGSRQGVDVSSIPLGAVDRIEIVADGASALYGSDAVAGVANILLKRDYSGLQTSVRYGAATEGAYSEQQYGAVAGTRWISGGFILAYEYASNTPIVSNDRSFAAAHPGTTIYPEQRHHAVTLSVHQALSDTLTFEADALFNKRWNRSGYPQNPIGDLSISRVDQLAIDTAWALSPALKLKLGNWRASLSGTYGKDDAATTSGIFVGATKAAAAYVCYCNAGRSVELAADGPIVELPGGNAQIAFGTGYRYNLLDAFRGAGNTQNIHKSQNSSYGYAELNLPLVSGPQGIALIHALSVSGAVRYEQYPGIGSIATPKFGVIFAPSADFDLKGSWGRSFRAPTLQQQYQARSASLYPAALLGGSGYPATATVLLVSGGNTGLQPERAKTWTATLDVHPRSFPGARLQVSYFSTIYQDRIVTPITFATQSLSDPTYAAFVSANPSVAAQSSIIASTLLFGNYSGAAYVPANVVAIVDDTNVNAGRQTIHGVDLLASYRRDLGGHGGSLDWQLDASYLESDQQLIAGQPVVQRAGLLFNPPHWHGRGGVTWRGDAVTLNGTVSYIGSVDDVQAVPIVPVKSMTTLDLTGRYRFAHAAGVFRNLEITVSAQNLLDDKPGVIATGTYADTTYDTTNYSPIGRFLSIGVTKKW